MEKLSFVILDESNRKTLPKLLAGDNPELQAEIEYIEDCFCGCAEENAEYAFSLVGDCLAVRIFDMGRYFFPYPFALADAADTRSALEHIVYYCVKEEIPIVFTDVPEEELCNFFALGYKDVRVRKEKTSADEEASYRVSLLTECTELDEIPTVKSGELSVSALVPEDIPAYARICKDTDNIALWGYDYREDMPNAEDEDFYRIANAELERGCALTVAIRRCGSVIGEAIFYAFDAKGGADFAFRLLPEYRGQGLSSLILPLIYECAGRIGLDRLMADIMKDNTVSCRMVSRTMTLISSDAEVNRYEIRL